MWNGSKLKQAREARGLSLRGLARRAAVSDSTIARIERGQINPTIAMVETLMAACGLSLTLEPRTVPLLVAASGVAGDEWGDWTPLRLVADHAAQHPNDVDLMLRYPPETDCLRARCLMAGVAEKVADDAGQNRPSWCAGVPQLEEPWIPFGTPRMVELNRRNSPAQFTARNIFVGGEAIWRGWSLAVA